MNKSASLPRRRRSFAQLTDADVRELVRPILGDKVDGAAVEHPGQGVNNRTYIVRAASGRAVVVKTRPRSSPNVRNSPQWPRYTQDLFGKIPDGDLSTLPEIARLLEQHGSIRVPSVHMVDQSCELAPCEYVIKEALEGEAFDWHSRRFTATAAAQLGDHLGRLHRATMASAWGIFARRELPTEVWWSGFARSYRRLARELRSAAPHLDLISEPLERALQRATSTGPPTTTAVVCVDQNPSHYLGARDGRVTALVDLEAHLWAPRELELAVVELWIGHTDAFWQAYVQHAPAPTALAEVRPAYWLYTWMEWCYCMHTLLHDSARAQELERGLIDLAARAA